MIANRMTGMTAMTGLTGLTDRRTEGPSQRCAKVGATWRPKDETATNGSWNIRGIWYESDTLPSKGLIRETRRVFSLLSLHSVLPRGSVLALGAFLALGCASPNAGTRSNGTGAPAVGLVAGPAPTVATGTTLTLAGARCTSASCRCRQPGQDDEETSPPAVGSKRFEIRMSADGGMASFDLSDLGHVATPVPVTAGTDTATPAETRPVDGGGIAVKETCAYIDVPAGSTHDAVFVARESRRGAGVAPRLSIAEYGPQGPFWYDVVAVTCDGAGGRCDRRAADEWGAVARQRKRGRLDPCGSTVISKLLWETSGGQAQRDGGFFRDFTVKFTAEIKRFATQFAPGSTECIPK